MPTTSALSPTPSSHPRWEDRPTGGALRLRSRYYPYRAKITLEMVVADGHPYWFLHVLDVPFEVTAGQA